MLRLRVLVLSGVVGPFFQLPPRSVSAAFGCVLLLLLLLPLYLHIIGRCYLHTVQLLADRRLHAQQVRCRAHTDGQPGAPRLQFRKWRFILHGFILPIVFLGVALTCLRRRAVVAFADFTKALAMWTKLRRGCRVQRQLLAPYPVRYLNFVCCQISFDHETDAQCRQQALNSMLRMGQHMSMSKHLVMVLLDQWSVAFYL